MAERNDSPESAREIVTTRRFAAPPERVFDAWSRAEDLARWWGPRGFTTTTHAFDFRPGGGWQYTMHGPDGADYRNRTVYEVIDRPHRIVFAHHGEVDGVPTEFTMTVTFAARGEETELTMRHVFRSAAERDTVIGKYGAVEGARETLARLDETLAASAAGTGRPELRMTRVFDAPRRLVFEAWSRAEHVARWFTPAPLTTPRCELDFRPGGVFRLVMKTPDGTEFPMEARFTEIVPEERIAFSASIHGGVEIETTVTFSELDGRTTLAVHQVYSHTTDATRGAHAGWTQTLTQLADHLRGRT